MARNSTAVVALIVCAIYAAILGPQVVDAARARHIVIDGNFNDWNYVSTLPDPDDAQDGSVLQDRSPDCHDTTHTDIKAVPTHVYNPDANILSSKFTHDDDNLYALVVMKGQIGRCQSSRTNPGRYALSIMINVDSSLVTGFWLNQGGYYPTTGGFDLRLELEWYNGSFNTAYFVNQAPNSTATLNAAKLQQRLGYVTFGPGNYTYSAQWVYWDSSSGHPTAAESQACSQSSNGPWALPVEQNGTICFVSYRGFPYSSSISFALSADGSTIELAAPRRGFLQDISGVSPLIKTGSTMSISVSTQVSGEYSVPVGSAVSDTTYPLTGYVVEAYEPPSFSNDTTGGDGNTPSDGSSDGAGPGSSDGDGDSNEDIYIGVISALAAFACVMCCCGTILLIYVIYLMRKSNKQPAFVSAERAPMVATYSA